MILLVQHLFSKFLLFLEIMISIKSLKISWKIDLSPKL